MTMADKRGTIRVTAKLRSDSGWHVTAALAGTATTGFTLSESVTVREIRRAIESIKVVHSIAGAHARASCADAAWELRNRCDYAEAQVEELKTEVANLRTQLEELNRLTKPVEVQPHERSWWIAQAIHDRALGVTENVTDWEATSEGEREEWAQFAARVIDMVKRTEPPKHAVDPSCVRPADLNGIAFRVWDGVTGKPVAAWEALGDRRRARWLNVASVAVEAVCMALSRDAPNPKPS